MTTAAMPTSGTWTLRPRALRTVIGLELRQRVRSRRWIWLLILWGAALLGLSLLIFLGALALSPALKGQWEALGALAFSADMVLLIFAMLLILPALASGSINGDRTAGTLATLQATLLSAAEIVVGKILAGWLIGLMFLLAALPAIVPAAAIMQAHPLRVMGMIAVVAALSLCITAISIGFSALTARQLGSVVLSYLGVLITSAVLPVVYALLTAMLVFPTTVTQYEPQTRYTGDYAHDAKTPCVKRTKTEDVPQTHLALPLLVVNPFVIVADVSKPVDPRSSLDPGRSEGGEPVDLLRILSTGVRLLADPPTLADRVHCLPEQPGYPGEMRRSVGGPVWPWGFGAYVLSAGAATWFAVRRLRTPARSIPRGQRIA